MRFGDLIVRPFKKTLALGLWETATCFAARISTLFPSSSAEEFWHTVGLPFRRIAAGDREAIRALAHFTGADEAALLNSSPEALGRSYLRIGDEIITTQDYVRGSYPICPACAEEDIAARPDLNPDQAVFGRLEWHATSVRTCRRHQRSLVDARAELTVGIAYHDFGFRTSSALNDLSSLRARSVERPTTPYEDYFVDRLQGQAKSIEILSGLKLHQVSRGCLAFGSLKLFGPCAARSSMTEDEKRTARQEGFSTLAQGQAGIADLLRQVLLDSGTRHTRSYTPMGTLGPVFEWLHYGTADAALSELKQVVAEEVFRTFPMAGGERFLGVINADPHMHTIHDVQRRFGVSWMTVKRVGQLAGVLTDLVEGGPKVMTAEDAKRLFEKVDDVVSLPVLAKELGASMKQVALLADRRSSYARLRRRRVDVLSARGGGRFRASTRTGCQYGGPARRGTGHGLSRGLSVCRKIRGGDRGHSGW